MCRHDGGALLGSLERPREVTSSLGRYQELERLYQEDLENRRLRTTRRLELHVHRCVDTVQELHVGDQVC